MQNEDLLIEAIISQAIKDSTFLTVKLWYIYNRDRKIKILLS